MNLKAINLLILTIFLLIVWTANSVQAETTNNEKYAIYGLDFSPYVDGQDPNYGSQISEQQLRDRLKIVAPYTQWIRTFGSNNGLEKTGKIAHEMGLKTAIGAWLSSDLSANEIEIANLINASKDGHVDIAIVGSEVLLRGDLSESQLIGYINRVKNEVPDIQVTTADVHGVILEHPSIISSVDVLFVNYYPYWEGVDIKNSITVLNQQHKQIIENSSGKPVIVSETGWPSCGNKIGNAVPSQENASFYSLNFISWANENNVSYFYFEAFDESWKAKYEGLQGACWGFWNKDGILKNGMGEILTLNITSSTNTIQANTPTNITFKVININTPISNVTINLSGTVSESKLTNSSGQATFTINSSFGNITVTANKIGYINNSIKISVIQDIIAYYRNLGNNPNIVETTDLLNAADDWSRDIAPIGFSKPITTQQLLKLADEWRNS